MRVNFNYIKCGSIEIVKKNNLSNYKIRLTCDSTLYNTDDKYNSKSANVLHTFEGESTDILKDFYHIGVLIEQNIVLKSKTEEIFDGEIENFLIENINYDEKLENMVIELYKKYGWFDITNLSLKPKNDLSVLKLLDICYKLYCILTLSRYSTLEGKRLPKLFKWYNLENLERRDSFLYICALLPFECISYNVNYSLSVNLQVCSIPNYEKKEAKVGLMSRLDNVVSAIALEIQRVVLRLYDGVDMGICENCGRYIKLISKRQKYCIPNIKSPFYEEELECFHSRDNARKAKSKEAK